jgi:hypothetical protein
MNRTTERARMQNTAISMNPSAPTVTSPDPGRTGPLGEADLRVAVADYEAAQRQRVFLGGCIRAHLLARPEPEMPEHGMTFPEVWAEEAGSATVAAVLVAVRKGQSDGPIPLVGRRYRSSWDAESTLRREVLALAVDHPAWRWIDGVPGAVPILAARLLARLDVERAPSVSSFWSFCGYATVPADRWTCAACGAGFDVARGSRTPPTHRRPGNGATCDGPLARDAAAPALRVAQRRGTLAAPPYDEVARKLCDLLGARMLSARCAYERYHRRELDLLSRERPGWPPARRHATASRKMNKLFLRHLWLVWRASAGLPVSRPDPGHDPAELTDPWSVTRPRTAPRSATLDRPVRH